MLLCLFIPPRDPMGVGHSQALRPATREPNSPRTGTVNPDPHLIFCSFGDPGWQGRTGTLPRSSVLPSPGHSQGATKQTTVWAPQRHIELWSGYIRQWFEGSGLTHQHSLPMGYHLRRASVVYNGSHKNHVRLFNGRRSEMGTRLLCTKECRGGIWTGSLLEP